MNYGKKHLENLLERIKKETLCEVAVVVDRQHSMFGSILSTIDTSQSPRIRYWMHVDSSQKALERGELFMLSSIPLYINLSQIKIFKSTRAARKYSERLLKLVAFK